MPVPQKGRQRSSASGPNGRHRWRVLAMPIRSVHDSLESDQREILAADRKRWKHMGAGGHLSDWMAFLPGMELRRAMAMKIARTNKPEGKGYTGALAALMMRDGLYDETTTTQPAKESFSAVLWFSEPPHRRQILQEIMRDMTPGQLARFNSPITARQRVKAIVIERGLEEPPKQRATHIVKPREDAAEVLSNRVKDLEGENEHLREQLAAAVSFPHREGGTEACISLFRLPVDDAANALLSYDTPNAVKIANAVLAKYATSPPRDGTASVHATHNTAEAHRPKPPPKPQRRPDRRAARR